MGPEAKLYKKLRQKSKGISWIRIENYSSLGTPDLLGYNTSGTFFTVELKVTKGKKLKFSPHQIAFHVKHPRNTFIIAQALGPRASKTFSVSMYRGSRIRELAERGLELEACCLGLEASIDYLLSIWQIVAGAWCLVLVSIGHNDARQNVAAWRLELGAFIFLSSPGARCAGPG